MSSRSDEVCEGARLLSSVSLASAGLIVKLTHQRITLIAPPSHEDNLLRDSSLRPSPSDPRCGRGIALIVGIVLQCFVAPRYAP
jgi:hypothetical protein